MDESCKINSETLKAKCWMNRPETMLIIENNYLLCHRQPLLSIRLCQETVSDKPGACVRAPVCVGVGDTGTDSY